MDAERFDRLSRIFSSAGSRRAILTGLSGGVLSTLLSLPESAARKKGKKGKGKKGKGKDNCRSSRECPQNQRCTARDCEPGCNDSQDCALGKVCRFGECRVVSCQFFDDCRDDEACDNTCRATCFNDIDCDRHRSRPWCVDTGVGYSVCVQCLDNSDCPGGFCQFNGFCS